MLKCINDLHLREIAYYVSWLWYIYHSQPTILFAIVALFSIIMQFARLERPPYKTGDIIDSRFVRREGTSVG